VSDEYTFRCVAGIIAALIATAMKRDGGKTPALIQRSPRAHCGWKHIRFPWFRTKCQSKAPPEPPDAEIDRGQDGHRRLVPADWRRSSLRGDASGVIYRRAERPVVRKPIREDSAIRQNQCIILRDAWHSPVLLSEPINSQPLAKPNTYAVVKVDDNR